MISISQRFCQIIIVDNKADFRDYEGSHLYITRNSEPKMRKFKIRPQNF